MAKHLHEKRGITFAEYGALLGTRAMLKAGDLIHTGDYAVKAGVHKFQMKVGCEQHGCGTVSCIGGTMALILGCQFPEKYVMHIGPAEGGHSPSLQTLFYPGIPATKWWGITPRQAVRAIDNWLETGKPRWRAVMKGVK